MPVEQRDVKFVLSAQDRASAAINGLRSHLGSLQDRVGGLNSLLGRAGALFGTAFAGTTLTAFIKGVASGIDELNDLADATGASATNLSALEDVAARTGVSLGDVGTAVLKFNKALTEARPGSDNERIFKRLSLDVAELKRLDPAEALRRTAVALSEWADDGDKARVVAELFGKSTREVAKFLKDLGTQTELVGTVSEEQALQAKRFNDQLDAMAKNSLDAARALASHLLPGLNQLLEKFNSSAQRGTLLLDVLKGIATFSPAATLAGALRDEIPQSSELQRLQQVIAGLENIQRREPDNEANNRRLANLREQVRLLEDAARFRTLVDTGAGGGRGLVNPAAVRPGLGDVLGGGEKKAGKSRTGRPEIAELPEFLRDAQREIERTDLAKIARIESALSGLIALRAANAGGPGAAAVDEAIAKAREELAKLDPAAQAAAEQTRQLNTLLANTPSAQITELRREIDLLNKALGQTADPERRKQIQEAIAGNEENIRKLSQVTKKTADEMEEFSRQAARNIQSALGDTIYRTFKGSADGIFDLWVDLLLRMASEAAAIQLGKLIFGSGGIEGFGASLGAGAGDLFKLFGGLFADGGRLGAGKWGIAGENGPELILGPAQVVPMSAAPAGGNTYITNHVAAGVTRHEVQSLLNQYGAMLMGRVDQRLRRSGVA